MAKLFYTIDEAAAKLGKSNAQLESMVAAGQLEQFVMHSTIHFKRAAIDQLVTDDLGDLDLSLNESSAEPLSPASGESDFADLAFEQSAGSGALDLGLDLGLDEALPLADYGAPASAAVGSKSPDGSSIADFPHDSGSQSAIGLADSGAKSSINTPPSAPAPAPAGSGAGLDLGLDLDLDLPAASGPAASGGIVLSDSGAMSKTPRSSDMSGSMAAKSGSGAPSVPSSGSAAGSDFAPSDSGGLNLETVGSGSGMLDLAGDADQSTMGAALLEDPGNGDADAGGLNLGGADDLFGGAQGDEVADQAPAAVIGTGGHAPVAVAASVAVDTASSGLGIGLLVGALASILLVAVIVVGTRIGGGSALAGMVTGDFMIWVGALAGGTIVAGGIGFFVGRAIE